MQPVGRGRPEFHRRREGGDTAEPQTDGYRIDEARVRREQDHAGRRQCVHPEETRAELKYQ